jgi:hypothetical protein
MGVPKGELKLRSILSRDAEDGSCAGVILIGPGIQYILVDCFGTESPECVQMSAQDILDGFWPKGRLTQISQIASGEVQLDLQGDLVYITLLPTQEADFVVAAEELRKVCKWAAREYRKATM